MDLFLDDRLPPLVEITKSTRQQSRRVARRRTPCAKCWLPLTPEDLCFADGRDAHRSCAETWNTTLLEGFETLKAQDQAEIEAAELEALHIERSARSMGLALPSTPQEAGLWTPPSSMPAASVPA